MAKHNTTPALFPILSQPHAGPEPTGIARLAALATHTDDGHLIRFHALQPRSILNRSVSKRQLPLDWSINPFRGCEFACRYCYARYTHQFLEPGPLATEARSTEVSEPQPWALAFEREIYLKENAAWLLEQELRQVKPGEEIAIGTATDPYQPIERRVGITRSLLEVLARQSGHRIGLITKSSLITRDIDLLTRIAERNTLVLHITVTTADAALARLLEPRAPRPDLRLEAVRKLREAGLTAGVLCSPLLPGINDSLQALEAVSGLAAAAGASFLGAHPLFLKSCSRPTWLSFVREHFPQLLPEYTKRYAEHDFTDAAYRSLVAGRVRQACRKHGLTQRSTDALLTRAVNQSGTTATAPLGKLPPRKSANTVSEPQSAQQTLFAAA